MYKDYRIRIIIFERGDAQHSRAGSGELSTPSTDEAKEFVAANAVDRDLGVCPTPSSSIRPRRFSSGAWATC